MTTIELKYASGGVPDLICRLGLHKAELGKLHEQLEGSNESMSLHFDKATAARLIEDLGNSYVACSPKYNMEKGKELCELGI
jgi:hypothetical protein